MGEFMKRTLAFIVMCLIGLPVASSAQNQGAPTTQNQEPDRMNVLFRANVRIEGNTSALTDGVRIQCSVGANWYSFDGNPMQWDSDNVIVQETGPIPGPTVIPVELRVDNVPVDVFTFQEQENFFDWACRIREVDGSSFTAVGIPPIAISPAYSGTCDRAEGTISARTFTGGGRSSCAR